MRTAPSRLAEIETRLDDGPEAALVVAPEGPEDVSTVLRYASDNELIVQVVGGGSHSGFGSPPPPDIVVSTERLDSVLTWEPDDLTMVVEPGARVGDIESRLSEQNQTAVLPEVAGNSTIGGVIAAGVSALRRGRLLGTRERVLEVTAVTGDGRIVRSGGRVVKNVSGFDLHRLHVGAFGSLGVIVSVCMKLWPRPPSAATVTVGDLEQAGRLARPLAVLEEDGVIRVFIWGTEDEVAAKASRLGGDVVAGHEWPADPRGVFEWSLRLPPAMTSDGVRSLPDGWRYVAIHGVGEIRAASENEDDANDLRKWAESVGGSLVLTGSRGADRSLDPWGKPPPGLEIQRSLIAQFDPVRIINPGRLPGGL